MDVDAREVRRRAWRIVGYLIWSGLVCPILLVSATAFGLAGLAVLWAEAPWLILALVGIFALCWVSVSLWSYAENKARTQLTHEKLTELTQEDDQ